VESLLELAFIRKQAELLVGDALGVGLRGLELVD
jgi:hypothetical protein